MGKEFPRDPSGRHLAYQLVRSATAGGANYEEARCAESRADFVHKIRIAAKEMREARFWLRLSTRADLFNASQLAVLETEADELIAILKELLEFGNGGF